MSTAAPFRQAPTLETERLVLRAHAVGDFEACCAMWADPLVARYTIGTPSTRHRTWLRILAYAGHWALLGFGYWAAEEKASGRYIGELGFADFKRDLELPIEAATAGFAGIDGIPELGWALTPSAHNQGFATEALRAAVAWGDEHFDGARTVCIISPDNSASLRVAAKLGYAEVARTTKNGEPELLFARPVSRSPRR